MGFVTVKVAKRWEWILGLADIRDLSVGLLQLSGTVIGYVGVCGAVRCSLRNEETCNVEQASWLHGLRVTMAVPANYKTIAMNCARVLWVQPSPKCADIFMIPMNVCFPLRFYLGVHLKKSFFEKYVPHRCFQRG